MMKTKKMISDSTMITTINSYVLLTQKDFKEHSNYKESKVAVEFSIGGAKVNVGDTVIFRKHAMPTMLTLPDGKVALRLERLSMIAVLKH